MEFSDKNSFSNFCVGDCVGGQRWAKLSQILKDALKNCASFDTSTVIGSHWGIMVLIEKPPKTYGFRGLELRGLVQNQISTRDCISQNDQRKKLCDLGDFENETPTHMSTTHAISKLKQKFQNRIPRELNQNFYIPGISMTPLIIYRFLQYKNR